MEERKEGSTGAGEGGFGGGGEGESVKWERMIYMKLPREKRSDCKSVTPPPPKKKSWYEIVEN